MAVTFSVYLIVSEEENTSSKFEPLEYKQILIFYFIFTYLKDARYYQLAMHSPGQKQLQVCGKNI